ncbi:MAG TPA: acetyl-CoA carboxylase biotin carboxyl carrier protein [Polyangia bacterium]|nr:acetyl-CoA carboxylase biotin carboxyl carrier protein [Polyangia bacterium]
MKTLRPTPPNSKRTDEVGPEGALPLRQIRELAKILAQNDLAEIEFENASVRVKLRRAEGTAGPVAVVAAPPAVIATAPGAANVSAQPLAIHPAPAAASAAPKPASVTRTPAAQPAPAEDGSTYITSPFVGTFYRSPSPDTSSFVEAGQRIKKGQVLCIVEAMKLMNEIESEVDGTILEIMVENAQPVEYGEPLFRIGP